MQQSCTYGSGRGALGLTSVPTATRECFVQSGKDEGLAVKSLAQVKDFAYKDDLAQHQRLDQGVSILKVIYLVFREDQPPVCCESAEEEKQKRCNDCELSHFN
jgi:hypothetical protein